MPRKKTVVELPPDNGEIAAAEETEDGNASYASAEEGSSTMANIGSEGSDPIEETGPPGEDDASILDDIPEIIELSPHAEMPDTQLDSDAAPLETLTPYGEEFNDAPPVNAGESSGTEELPPAAKATGSTRKRGRSKKQPPKSADTPAESITPKSGKPKSDKSENPTAAEDRKAFFALDFNKLDRELTPEQQQEWSSIYASYRGHNVMRGSIMGIDRHRIRARDCKTGEVAWHELYCAIIIPFRVRILIPETEMWDEGDERPAYVMRNISGASIDFVIIHVDREAGFAIGSRRLALRKRKYFFSTQPGLNTLGSRVNCDLLVVGPRRCLVSCFGYDIDLTQRELSYTAIPDLRDVYHSGDTLPCVIKSYDPPNNQLVVSVKETAPNPYDGAEFRHPVHSHRQAVIAGKYGGGVFCNLSDDVTVMCNYSFHYDDASFKIGDRVILIIQRYEDDKKQIYGKIVAKC